MPVAAMGPIQWVLTELVQWLDHVIVNWPILSSALVILTACFFLACFTELC